jgi:hypothetical protein
LRRGRTKKYWGTAVGEVDFGKRTILQSPNILFWEGNFFGELYKSRERHNTTFQI